MSHPVGKNDVATQTVMQAIQTKIHKENAINSFQVKHPAGTFFALPHNGTRQVEQGTFAEIHLAAVLHFHDKLLAVLIGTVNVINTVAVFHRFSHYFLVEETDIQNVLLTGKQAVQEINQQILVDFLTEDALEPHICKRVDKSRHRLKNWSFYKDKANYWFSKTYRSFLFAYQNLFIQSCHLFRHLFSRYECPHFPQ